MARKAFPGQPCSLDALCKRFAIDTSERTHHGALLDARLLADVYLELCGGRQRGLSMQFAVRGGTTNGKRETRKARPHEASADEIAAHDAAIGNLKDNLWKTA
jgi:DNA polymerase-3 subunit epsilon